MHCNNCNKDFVTPLHFLPVNVKLELQPNSGPPRESGWQRFQA